MAYDWSQVEIDRWMLREEVDPQADATLVVIASIWSAPQNGGAWQWRVEVSDGASSNEVIADRAATEEEARQYAEIAVDEALVNLRENAT